jgi:hypothetical protein
MASRNIDRRVAQRTPVGVTLGKLVEVLAYDLERALLAVTLGALGLETVPAYWYSIADPEVIWIVTDSALLRVRFSGPHLERRAELDTFTWDRVHGVDLQIETLMLMGGPHLSARFTIVSPPITGNTQSVEQMVVIGSFIREVGLRARGR